MCDTRSRPDVQARLVRVGAIGWIAGAVQFFTCHVIVQMAWSPPYSWARNNISDLGNVHCGFHGTPARYICSPLHALMNVSSVLVGVLVILGLLLTRNAWGGTFTSRYGRMALTLAGAGWITAALSPADVNESLHVTGAAAVFFGTNIGLILIGLPPRSAEHRGFRIFSAVVGTIGLIAAILFIEHQYLGLGMGGMERITVFTMQLWTVVSGCLLLVFGTSDVAPEPPNRVS